MSNTKKIPGYGPVTAAAFAVIAALALTLAALSLAGCGGGAGDPPGGHAHDWTEWTVTSAATCTTAGEETRTCALDAAHIETREIAINPEAHLWDEWNVITPATCLKEGEGTRVCKLCEIDSPNNIIPIDLENGHDWDDESWEETTGPTCTEDGIETTSCTLNITPHSIQSII